MSALVKSAMEVLWVLLVCACAVSGFNVDIPSCVRHHAPQRGSMFGFAVQEHVEEGQKWVLVGAPEDDTRRRPGVVRPGAVYRCDIQREDACSEVIFDRIGNNNDTGFRQIDQKSNQWFGATVTSAGIGGPIVACAPRYVSFVSAKLNQREPVGSCYVARNAFTDVNEYAPCRTDPSNYREASYGYHRTGVCQAGFSAAVSKDGGRLFMGAPGSWYWQGQLYSQSLASRPIMVATSEGASHNDDSYLGYSVAAGDFAGHGQQGVAVGMPRGADLQGKVVMYTWDLENIKNVTGSQVGCYFGYSIAAGDIDGDGLDDLIVGAPMYTVPNNEGSFEQGRVYVIYQGRGLRRFQLNDYRTGEVSRGRFGLSLTSLGDINMDSFGDFAVGSPYGGKKGRGVVFLYYGSKDGVREKYSQAITAEEISPQLTTFGFSLSGGVDLDGNNYTDLVVGAYKSDMAVVLKARPVVKVHASVQMGAQSQEISLEDTDCTLRSGQKVACMSVEYCLRYYGVDIDTRTEFDLFLDLDSLQKKSRRMFLLAEENQHTYNRTITINHGQQWCGNTKIYIVHDVRDKLTPLQVTMEYKLRAAEQRSRAAGYIPPVLDMNEGNSKSDAVNISKNCGPDNVCIPNLKMHIEPSVSKYLLGSQEKLGINVFIENSGEDAFEASYYLRIPPGIDFVKTERLETGRTEVTAVHCLTPIVDDDGNTTLRCDIGNPLPSQQMVNFKVVLQPYDIEGTAQKYVFTMETNSTNPEKETQRIDNTYKLTVGVFVDTNVSIIGLSIPPDLHYNASLYQSGSEKVIRDTEFGPHVVHAYSVKNNGPSFVEEAEIFLIWPYQTLAGDDLFYMLNQPETWGDIKCDVADHVNDQRFIIDRKEQLFLPQVIQGLIANEQASNKSVSASFTSEEERRRIELEQEKYSGHRDTHFSGSSGGGQSSMESHQTWNSNSGRTQGGSSQQGTGQYGSGGHYSGGSNQYGSQSSRGSNQYGGSTQQGSNFNQQGSNFNQQGSNLNQQVSNSNQQGNSGQYGSGSGQYGSTSHQYGSNSNQYGGNSNQQSWQHLGSGQQGGSFGVTAGANQGASGGRTYNIYREKNTTLEYDADGHIKKTETSTEYGDLGHEGEIGSSWNNRQGHSYRGSSSASQQGGYNQRNQAGGGNFNYNSGSNVGGSGQNLGWSTEESVNKNLFNAGSRSSMQGSYGSNSEVEEVVGGEEGTLGGFANVAGNPDNEFRTVWTDVDNEGGSAHAGSANSQSGTRVSQQSYGSNGAYSGGSSSGAHGAANGGASGYGGARGGGSSQSSWSSSSQGYGGGGQSGSSWHESKQYSSSSSGGHSSETSGRSANYQQYPHRSKRQNDYLEYDKDVALVLANCTNNFKCSMFRCVTGPLQKNQEVWVSLRGRINAKFLNEMSKDREVLLTTVAGARVSKLPYMGRPMDAALTTFQAATHVTPQLEVPSSGSVPLWVVVLAAVAGALLLLLLILLLYKCGFFKRNRPTDHAERQPLNRNGYGHGDEHL